MKTEIACKQTRAYTALKCKIMILKHLYACISLKDAVGSKYWKAEGQAEVVLMFSETLSRILSLEMCSASDRVCIDL